jgi:hypothetical protein
MLASIDVETYVEKGYDLRNLTLEEYVADKRFRCYLISVWSEPGLVYCGPPTEEVHRHLADCDGFIAHNAGFERAVFRALGWANLVADHWCWYDTADLSVYLQCGRSLRSAAEVLLKDIPPKGDVDLFHPPDMLWPGQVATNKEIADYCVHDARLSWLLYQRYAAFWPPVEQEISMLNLQWGEYGVAIDWSRLDQMRHDARTISRDATARVPYKPPLSIPKLGEHCRTLGIPAPTSTRQDSAEFEEWLEVHAEKVDFVAQLRRLRKANRFVRMFETMESMRRPDATIPCRLLYIGAEVTGRFSGTDGLNFQNFNRSAWEGIDPRSVIVARPGHKLVIADLSQIEPRCLAWAAGDTEFFDLVRQYQSVYVATGMKWGMIQAPEECTGPKKQLIKALVLGCGYGASAATFRRVAGTYGVQLSEDEAEERVRFFRASSPKICAFWERLMFEFRTAGDTYKCRLPSGRVLRYRQIRKNADGELICSTRIDPHVPSVRRVWHGVLAENYVSGLARDVFVHGLIDMAMAGVKIRFTAHDEIVAEAPAADAEACLAQVMVSLTKVPEWMPGLLLGAEGKISDRYLK